MPYQFQNLTCCAASVGLYIHIPFCVRKCDYCDFYSLADPTPQARRAFQEAMVDWLAQISGDIEGREVDTVYIGGGTPSCYDTAYLVELLTRVREWFPLTADCEISVECNPDSAGEEWLAAMRRAGVNRLSMGVQSANDEELRAVGRLHDFATAQNAFRRARSAGFDNLSLDLIYGLPGQTMERWQRSVESLIELGPEHLSCYGLKIEEGTPLWRRQDTLSLADDDAQADMYLWMVERLEQAGYGQYEISNFARPGKFSRHNMRYWLGQEYICAGPGAHGYLDGYRYALVRDMKGFVNGVFGSGPLCQRRRVDEKERVREYVLLQMRTVWGISREEYEGRFGLDFTALEQQLVRQKKYGWAAQNNGRWHFTPKGFLVSNALIGQLLEIQENYLSE